MSRVYLSSPMLGNEVRKILTQPEIGLSLIDIPACSSLAAPVSTHPDMLFYRLRSGGLLTDSSYYAENPEFFSGLEGLTDIITSEARVSEKYPGDIRFDVLDIDGTVYGRMDFAAPEITAECKKAVNVRQGYARCAVLKLEPATGFECSDCSCACGTVPDGLKNRRDGRDFAAVTADKQLYNALTADGIDTLLISHGGIMLPGYDCGFIGGASVCIEEKRTVVFFGDISRHADYENIRNFISRWGYDIKYPSGVPLFDSGSLVRVR